MQEELRGIIVNLDAGIDSTMSPDPLTRALPMDVMKETLSRLKKLERDFTDFWKRAEKEICEGQMMKVEHLSRLRELIGIEIEKGPEVGK